MSHIRASIISLVEDVYMYQNVCDNPSEIVTGSKVHKFYVPDWFTKRMRKELGSTDLGYRDGDSLIRYHGSSNGLSRLWIDHPGSTLVDDVAIFVSEPYLTLDYDFGLLEEFAWKLDCNLVVSETSFHCPGKTIRIAFMPVDMDAVRGQRRVRGLHRIKDL